MVVFAVPESAREAAPGDPAALCPTCLTLVAADEPVPDPDFSRIVEGFPEGRVGALMAVATGLLVESLALNRRTVAELFDAVGDEGADPWLLLERLAASPTIRPDADLGRARRQLEQLLDR